MLVLLWMLQCREHLHILLLSMKSARHWLSTAFRWVSSRPAILCKGTKIWPSYNVTNKFVPTRTYAKFYLKSFRHVLLQSPQNISKIIDNDKSVGTGLNVSRSKLVFPLLPRCLFVHFQRSIKLLLVPRILWGDIFLWFFFFCSPKSLTIGFDSDPILFSDRYYTRYDIIIQTNR